VHPVSVDLTAPFFRPFLDRLGFEVVRFRLLGEPQLRLFNQDQSHTGQIPGVVGLAAGYPAPEPLLDPGSEDDFLSLTCHLPGPTLIVVDITLTQLSPGHPSNPRKHFLTFWEVYYFPISSEKTADDITPMRHHRSLLVIAVATAALFLASCATSQESATPAQHKMYGTTSPGY
jgi:hypothetical protein